MNDEKVPVILATLEQLRPCTVYKKDEFYFINIHFDSIFLIIFAYFMTISLLTFQPAFGFEYILFENPLNIFDKYFSAFLWLLLE